MVYGQAFMLLLGFHIHTVWHTYDPPKTIQTHQPYDGAVSVIYTKRQLALVRYFYYHFRTFLSSDHRCLYEQLVHDNNNIVLPVHACNGPGQVILNCPSSSWPARGQAMASENSLIHLIFLYM